MPLQDLDRLVDGRLVDHDRLEPALQRRVLLDVLAVLVQGGGADALHLAAGQAGLRMLEASTAPSAAPAPTSVCSSSMNRIASLLARSSSMIFLSRSSNSPRYLVPATSEPMSRVSTRLSISVSGTSPRDDALGQALDDGRLADARLADQHRVVLGVAAEDLDDPLDLLLAADDRVELAGPGQLGQVDAELVEGRRLGRTLRLLRRADAGARLRQDVDHLVADLLQVDAQALQHAGGDALALADQARAAGARCRCSGG